MCLGQILIYLKMGNFYFLFIIAYDHQGMDVYLFT